MMPALLSSMCCLALLIPIQGSKLKRLEEDVKSLKSFMFRELGNIRDEVKQISNRVEVLENDTQKPSAHIQDRQSFEDEIRGDDTKPGPVATAEMGNIRKAFSKDKKDLHKLKQDVKGQLRQLEEKIDTHLENLTSEVQHNIKYIHQNISLANADLLDVMKEFTANVSKFSDNLRIELAEFAANISEQFSLRFNETEDKMKKNISSTYHYNDNKLKSFMALADGNISEIMLKADNIVSLMHTNLSKVPTQITNLSMELDSVKQNVHFAEEKLKQIIRYLPCSMIQDGYVYPCGAKDIRLANASLYRSTGVQGRLEVRHNEEWGTVCDDSFESHYVGEHVKNNVNVVCAIFKFRECDYVRIARLGVGSGPILMDEVKCDGEESSFMDCPHSGWGVHNCDHDEDVGFQMWY